MKALQWVPPKRQHTKSRRKRKQKTKQKTKRKRPKQVLSEVVGPSKASIGGPKAACPCSSHAPAGFGALLGISRFTFVALPQSPSNEGSESLLNYNSLLKQESLNEHIGYHLLHLPCERLWRQDRYLANKTEQNPKPLKVSQKQSISWRTLGPAVLGLCRPLLLMKAQKATEHLR